MRWLSVRSNGVKFQSIPNVQLQYSLSLFRPALTSTPSPLRIAELPTSDSLKITKFRIANTFAPERHKLTQMMINSIESIVPQKSPFPHIFYANHSLSLAHATQDNMQFGSAAVESFYMKRHLHFAVSELRHNMLYGICQRIVNMSCVCVCVCGRC